MHAIIHGAADSQAAQFYRRFPDEPTSDGVLTVRSTDIVPMPNPTLDSLLDTILSLGERNLLIVAHGHPQGLAMPIVPQTNNQRNGRADANLVRVLNDASYAADQAAETLNISMGLPPVPPTGRGLTGAIVTLLRGKMSRVQAMGLRRIDFRGCNLAHDDGTHHDTLQVIHDFFGVGAISAPDCESCFSVVPCQIAPQPVLDRQARSTPQDLIATYQYGPAGVAALYARSRERYPNWMLATDPAAVTRFAASCFGRDTTPNMTGQVPYHVLLTGRPRFSFSQDESYLSHIQSYPI